MRVARSIEKVSVLVVIGVTENGQKQVIGIQSGDKESASSWREIFRDLLRGAISSLRSCIADVFFLKIVFNDRRLLLAAS